MAGYAIGILLYEGFEAVSALLPHAILGAAADRCDIEVTTYSLVPSETVAAASGLEVVPDDVLIGTPDLVFVPGWEGATGSGALGGSTVGTDEVTDRLGTLYEGGADVATLSSGVLLLGKAGLLEERRIACGRQYRGEMGDYGATVEETEVVEDGCILTGAAPPTGFDVALRIVERECGESTANVIAERFEIDSRGDVIVTKDD